MSGSKDRKVYTVKGLQKSLRMLPREASAQLRDASIEIAQDVAAQAQARARGRGGVAKLVAPSIRATRDRVPVVRMGSTARLPSEGAGWSHGRSGSRQTIGDIIWGAEFGGGRRPTTQQFLPHLGTIGYFLWPTIRAESADTGKRYSEALDEALKAI